MEVIDGRFSSAAKGLDKSVEWKSTQVGPRSIHINRSGVPRRSPFARCQGLVCLQTKFFSSLQLYFAHCLDLALGETDWRGPLNKCSTFTHHFLLISNHKVIYLLRALALWKHCGPTKRTNLLVVDLIIEFAINWSMVPFIGVRSNLLAQGERLGKPYFIVPSYIYYFNILSSAVPLSGAERTFSSASDPLWVRTRPGRSSSAKQQRIGFRGLTSLPSRKH